MSSTRSQLSSWLSIAGRLCFVGAMIFGILEIAGRSGWLKGSHYTISSMTHMMSVSGLGWMGGLEAIVNDILYAPVWVMLLALGLLLRVWGWIASLGGK